MTVATVFNSFDVVQTAGSPMDWVDNGFGGIQYPWESGVTFTHTLSVIDGYEIEDLAKVRIYISAGDSYQLSINGNPLIEYGPGSTYKNFNVTEFTELSYVPSGYSDPLNITLLNSVDASCNLVESTPESTSCPFWTTYVGTTEECEIV